ncbi:hypothetical protein SAMN05518849_1416 [Sphingobium sp. AP50]|uniref:hypothetical protein n=1 Tax=Sphingobium sp. AP50 TaxID=1884369 RepID=UPI0008C987A3|nr:hypothetical protein [Sphingobium sp. AP50]SEK06237.1 hypothetical protein SAMN05518849_1416 [Sphingobium sp. AP50]
MLKLMHPVAGAVAILLISGFWLSTAVVELFGTHSQIVTVKTLIPWGFLFLIPALAATGASGLVLAKGRRSGLIGIKMKRMPFVAANGLLILVPAAFFLAYKATSRQFDTNFAIVQMIELLAGAANLTLLSLNMRDGFRMRRRMLRQQHPQ